MMRRTKKKFTKRKMRIWQEKMERKERRKNFIVKGGAFLYN